MSDVLDRLRTARPMGPSASEAPSIEEVWRRIGEPAGTAGPARARGAARHVRFAVAVSLACGVTAAILMGGVLGAGPSQAFAGWRATPTAPRAGEISTAESACPARTTLLVADIRGPFSLLLYLTSPETGDPAGAVIACLPELNSQSFVGVPVQDVAPGAVAVADIETDYASFAGAPVRGSAYTYIVGQVGTAVTGVTLDLQDGTQVQATATNGWFAAWWPGQQGATNAQVLTSTGSVTIPISTPPHPSASSPVGRALAGN